MASIRSIMAAGSATIHSHFSHIRSAAEEGQQQMEGFKKASETTAESQLGAVAAKHCHLEGLLQQLYGHDLHLLSFPSTGVREGSRKLSKDLIERM